MSELANVEAPGSGVLATPELFQRMSSPGDYLPRLQLCGGTSLIVKECKIPVAHWASILKEDQFTDLGAEVDIIPLAWRAKAMEIGDDQIINLYDPGPKDNPNKDFQAIQLKSDIRDSGCMFGPEFLVWIPKIKIYATYFMNNKTARRESPKVLAQIGKASTLKAHFIKTAKYSWHGPVCTPCSTPLVEPDMVEVKKQQDKFNNPPKSEVVTVDAATDRVR